MSDILPAEFIEKQSKYVYEPEAWARDIIGFEPDTWQKEAMHDFIEHKFLAISTGTGVGKTALLSVLIWFFLSTRPFPKIPCTAPTGHQLFDVLWAELAKWQRQSKLLRDSFRWTQKKITFIGHGEEWFAVARTSRPQPGKISSEALQGFHADHLLFIVDEASGIPDQIMNAVDGAITTPGAYIILTSNPTRRSGYFYRAITDKRLDIEHGGSFKVRHVSCEDAKYTDPIHMERAVRIYGRSSDFYRIKVLGLPPLSESESLLTPEQVYEAHLRPAEKTGQVYLSCDPARYGGDSTVFYVRKGWTIIDRKVVRGMDTMLVAKMGMDLVKFHNPDYYSIDIIGIGSGVYDKTRLDYQKEVPPRSTSGLLPVTVGEKAREADKYYNLRAEIYWNLRTFIDLVSIPMATDLLDEELTTITYGWDTKDARIKIQSKDEIKKSLEGRSPNDADAFALNFFPLVHAPITVSESYFGVGTGAPRSEVVDKTKHQPHVGEQVQRTFFGQSNYGVDDMEKRGSPVPSALRVVGAARYGAMKRNHF